MKKPRSHEATIVIMGAGDVQKFQRVAAEFEEALKKRGLPNTFDGRLTLVKEVLGTLMEKGLITIDEDGGYHPLH